MRATEFITEKWSEKYKRSINCNNPKGFSQRAHCQGRKKKTNEAVGIITKQNATKDAPIGSEFANVKKLGLGSGKPKLLTNENFADGKVKGKSRPGRVKRAGASCKGSVSSLRAKAKKYSGEKGKMYHWCANMKGGKK